MLSIQKCSLIKLVGYVEYKLMKDRIFFGGFDPGSERTLAAWIRHASRAVPSNRDSGKRVSNTWVTCPPDGDNFEKSELIPDNPRKHKLFGAKGYPSNRISAWG